MKRLVAVLLALGTLASGCGDDPDETGTSGTDPQPTSSTSLTPDDVAGSGQATLDLLGIVSESAVDGEVSTAPTYEVDDPGFADFVSQFTDPRMAEAIDAELASYEPAAGTLLAATVVAIGCDEPRDVTVATEDGGLVVEPVADKAAPEKQCLVPVTSVALYELGLPS